MARIVVVGTVGLDRVWKLDRPLRAGGRHACEGVMTRLGGGGFNTGDVLVGLGHEVTLVTNLADDEAGRWCRATLDERGFDTRFVGMAPGSTVVTEILVEPAGERTILRRAGPRPLDGLMLPSIDADGAYFNVRRLNPAAAVPLTRFPRIVSQIPMELGEVRPADVLIASRSDVPESAAAVLWRDGVAISGSRLETIVLTNGPYPVTVIERDRAVHVAAMPVISAGDTTGAGDFFAAGYMDAALAGWESSEAARIGCVVAARRLGARQDSITARGLGV